MAIAVKAPPVCTAYWNESDWESYFAKNSIETEPETIESTFGIWHKTGEKDSKVMALYSLKSKV